MGYGYGYGGYGGGYAGGDVIFHLVFGGLFLVILVALAVILLRGAFGGWRRNMWRMGQDSAVELLKERYAKGEIDRKEFEEKKRDLMS